MVQTDRQRFHYPGSCDRIPGCGCVAEQPAPSDPGIEDPRTDKRIDFVGGIRGLEELEKRVNDDMEVAFAVYPVDVDDLLRVADNNMVMPPKSTWFEPKLGSGLFLHSLK